MRCQFLWGLFWWKVSIKLAADTNLWKMQALFDREILVSLSLEVHERNFIHQRHEAKWKFPGLDKAFKSWCLFSISTLSLDAQMLAFSCFMRHCSNSKFLRWWQVNFTGLCPFLSLEKWDCMWKGCKSVMKANGLLIIGKKLHKPFSSQPPTAMFGRSNAPTFCLDFMPQTPFQVQASSNTATFVCMPGLKSVSAYSTIKEWDVLENYRALPCGPSLTSETCSLACSAPDQRLTESAESLLQYDQPETFPRIFAQADLDLSWLVRQFLASIQELPMTNS